LGGVGEDEVDGEFGRESRGSRRPRLHEGERRLRRLQIRAHFLPGLREARIGGGRCRYVGGEASAGDSGEEGGGSTAEHGDVRVGSLGLARSERERKSEGV